MSVLTHEGITLVRIRQPRSVHSAFSLYSSRSLMERLYLLRICCAIVTAVSASSAELVPSERFSNFLTRSMTLSCSSVITYPICNMVLQSVSAASFLATVNSPFCHFRNTCRNVKLLKHASRAESTKIGCIEIFCCIP